MFRSEAREHYKNRLNGEALRLPSDLLRLSAILCISIISGIAYFLFFYEYREGRNITGWVERERGSSIYSPLNSGFVSQIYVVVGQAVQKGDPLFSIKEVSSTVVHESNEGLVLLELTKRSAAISSQIDQLRIMMEADLNSLQIEERLLTDRTRNINERQGLLSNRIDTLNARLQRYKDPASFGVVPQESVENVTMEIYRLKKERLVLDDVEASVRGGHEKLKYEMQLKKSSAQFKIHDLQLELSKIEEHKISISKATERIINAASSGVVGSIAVMEGDLINTSEELMRIEPESSNFRTKAVAHADVAAHLKVGQIVNVSLDAYPYRQFGTFESRIVEISNSSGRAERTGSQKNRSAESFYTIAMEPIAGIADRDVTLLDGMSLKVRVPMSKSTPFKLLLEKLEW